ncbi:hypothetical protein DICVIV_07580 [Dictyocaulus viviparus]|uniref:Uncharacterized protein n=1 Tax=Dictyocaulus viviparus TaxID=29172 RepID=A0A0D8XPB5_DICVI|nr:hypothetical protein DICVIV_07580 [Dictyocaulus viviparus]
MTDSEFNFDERVKSKFGNLDDDCERVVSHVACVTIESDSLPESPNMPRITRKKRRLVRRPRGHKMDIDFQPSTSQNCRMEWDGAESCLSSTSESECGNCAADADDEQSDWVGYARSVTEGDFVFKDPSEERRVRRLQRRQQMSQIQRRLERFAFEGGSGEMSIEFRIKDRLNSFQFNRMLLHYRLEVVKRQRGALVIRRRSNSCNKVSE